MLGLATLVAIYFWLPLLWKRIDTGSAASNDSPKAVASVPGPIVGAEATANAATPDVPPRPDWQQIIQWRKNDPRTMIAPPLSNSRDPFAVPQVESTAQLSQENQPALKPPTISPESAGLVLTSTIIGPQRRVARISGRTYAIGQTIEVVKDGERGAVFKLIDVQPRRAVLESDGQRYDLLIPEPSKSDKIELLGSTDTISSPYSLTPNP